MTRSPAPRSPPGSMTRWRRGAVAGLVIGAGGPPWSATAPPSPSSSTATMARAVTVQPRAHSSGSAAAQAQRSRVWPRVGRPQRARRRHGHRSTRHLRDRRDRSGHARVPDDVEVAGGDARDLAFSTAVAHGAGVVHQRLNPPSWDRDRDPAAVLGAKAGALRWERGRGRPAGAVPYHCVWPTCAVVLGGTRLCRCCRAVRPGFAPTVSGLPVGGLRGFRWQVRLPSPR